MSEIRVAIARSTCGHVTVVGPNDFKRADFSDAMEAAISWHIEAGYGMPVRTHWAMIPLPPLNDEPDLVGRLEETE